MRGGGDYGDGATGIVGGVVVVGIDSGAIIVCGDNYSSAAIFIALVA